MSKDKTDVMEPTRVELFGVEVELWEYQDFTPVQQIHGSELLNRMSKAAEEDAPADPEAIFELGLLLTYSPQFKKPVTLEAFRKMFRRPRTSDERVEVRKFNQELTDQVIAAGKAVMDVVTAHLKAHTADVQAEADKAKTKKGDSPKD